MEPSLEEKFEKFIPPPRFTWFDALIGAISILLPILFVLSLLILGATTGGF